MKKGLCCSWLHQLFLLLRFSPLCRLRFLEFLFCTCKQITLPKTGINSILINPRREYRWKINKMARNFLLPTSKTRWQILIKCEKRCESECKQLSRDQTSRPQSHPSNGFEWIFYHMPYNEVKYFIESFLSSNVYSKTMKFKIELKINAVKCKHHTKWCGECFSFWYNLWVALKIEKAWVALNR